MVNRAIFGGFALSLFLCASSANAEDSLGRDPFFRLDSHQLVLSHQGKLEIVELDSHRIISIGSATNFAVDPKNQDILSIVPSPEGTVLREVMIRDSAPVLRAGGLLRQHVYGIQWTGKDFQFCIETVAPKFDPKQIPFFSEWLVRSTGKSGTFQLAPVPGISDVAMALGGGSPLFDPRRIGCWALSTIVGDPAIVLQGAHIEGDDAGSSAFFVIGKQWHPWLALAVRFMSGSIPIAFSDDGSHLLALLFEPKRTTPLHFASIDLENLEIGDVSWLSTEFDVPLAVNGNLTEALQLVERPSDNIIYSDTKTMLTLDEQADAWADAHGWKNPPNWMLVGVGERHPATFLMGFAEHPNLGFIAEKTTFIVTDGATIWTMDGSKVYDETKIDR